MNNITGDLFTGMTSVTARDIKAQREARRKKMEQSQAEVQASDLSILDLIEKSRKELPQKLWDLVSEDLTKEDMEAKKLALKLLDEELKSFHSKVSILMNKRPLPESSDE